MNDVGIAFVLGLVLGILFVVQQYSLVKSGRSRVIRDMDGNVSGGFYKILLGVGILWTVIGFVLVWGLVKLIRVVL
jgi:hypothetical protein